MIKKIAQIRTIVILLLFVEEIVVIAIYLSLSLSKFFLLMNYVTIKNIILIGLIIYISSIAQNNAISVSEALESDAGKALIFGGVGLIQYDESRNITWISDLLVANKYRIIGLKLLDWEPTLAGLFENEEVRIIDVKGKKYEAYNNEETRMIYLKDVTQFISLNQDFEDQQLCMAYITIDNFEETLENLNEPDAVKVQSTARQIIIDWAYSNGMIIRRYKTGGYIAFFNERIYKKQVEDKFSILDSFKKKTFELDEVLTLSMGIGRGSRVLRELEEQASSALQLTYSRGGDQVCIKSGKDNVRFFGGTSDALEKSSKVRARVVAQSLVGLIKRSHNVLVMGHKMSDLDSLGGSLAMARFALAYDKRVHIVLDYNSLEAKSLNVTEKMRIDPRYNGLIISVNEALEKVNRDTLLIAVDNHKPSLAISESLLEAVKNKVIIDHHRRGEEFIEAPILTYLEPSASSTVELIVELTNYINMDIPYNEMDATIMYAGLLVDTSQFKQRVGVRTFQVAAKLKELNADVVEAHEFLEDSYDSTLEVMNITRTASLYRDNLLIACASEDKEVAIASLAKSSNRLLDISGVKASFSIGRTSKNHVNISSRSYKEMNVQMIMEKLGGGGHFTMAACQLENISISEAKERLMQAIDEYLEERGN